MGSAISSPRSIGNTVTIDSMQKNTSKQVSLQVVIIDTHRLWQPKIVSNIFASLILQDLKMQINRYYHRELAEKSEYN